MIWESLFCRDAPRVVDLGCGDGEFLVRSAVAHPERDHLGIDILEPVVRRATVQAGSVTNVRFVVGDAAEWVRRLTRLAEVHIYHPQPYFHPEQARLGMLTPGFFEDLWRATIPGGLLVLQTDHKVFGRYLVKSAEKHFEVTERDAWSDAPSGRTHWERIAFRRKLSVLRFECRRREEPLLVEVPPAFFEQPRRQVRSTRPRRDGRLRGVRRFRVSSEE